MPGSTLRCTFPASWASPRLLCKSCVGLAPCLGLACFVVAAAASRLPRRALAVVGRIVGTRVAWRTGTVRNRLGVVGVGTLAVGGTTESGTVATLESYNRKKTI